MNELKSIIKGLIPARVLNIYYDYRTQDDIRNRLASTDLKPLVRILYEMGVKRICLPVNEKKFIDEKVNSEVNPLIEFSYCSFGLGQNDWKTNIREMLVTARNITILDYDKFYQYLIRSLVRGYRRVLLKKMTLN